MKKEKNKRSFVDCKVCGRNFKQRNIAQFLCRAECRLIFIRDKRRKNPKPRKKILQGPHPFDTFSVGRKKKQEDKAQLRLDIKKATEEFLLTKKITILPPSPNGKVAEVLIPELKELGDSPSFYTIEEEPKLYPNYDDYLTQI